MKRSILTCLILLLAVCTVGCSTPIKASTEKAPSVSKEKNLSDTYESEKDKKMARKAIEDIFDAYNSSDNTRITSALHKYINPDERKLFYKDAGEGMNSITVNGRAIYNDGVDLRENKLVLKDNDVSIFSNIAVVKGYADGSVSIQGKEVEKGPWQVLTGMYKSGGAWFIEYIKLTRVDMVKLEYYTQLPKDFGKDPNKKWPLIVFLHGAGERGGKLEDIKKMNHSIPMVAATSKDFPFVAVSPLCPDYLPWKDLPYPISSMIDEVTAKYNIDTDRIYLTGLSLGGIGTWSLALQFPDKFAAIAPVCGSVDPDKVERLKDLPIWAFHGAKDTVVPMDQEQIAVDRLKACGGNIKYTVYPDVEHDAWNKAYPNPELYEWFLQHTRSKNKSQK